MGVNNLVLSGIDPGSGRVAAFIFHSEEAQKSLYPWNARPPLFNIFKKRRENQPAPFLDIKSCFNCWQNCVKSFWELKLRDNTMKNKTAVSKFIHIMCIWYLKFFQICLTIFEVIKFNFSIKSYRIVMSKKLGFFEDFMLSGVAAGVSKVILT